jgi:dTDP-D-glucose 4,6-dehydratase
VERLLQETFDWYVHNESWWRGILDGSYRALGQLRAAADNRA